MITYTPMPVKHRSTFVTELKFMHGDADFYSTEHQYTDTEAETEELVILLRLLSTRRSRELSNLEELQQNESFVKFFYSDTREDYEKFMRERVAAGDARYTNGYTFSEYLDNQAELQWPTDKSNWVDRCALDGFTTYWYDENGTQFRVTVSQ